jgi:hypothetical protein
LDRVQNAFMHHQGVIVRDTDVERHSKAHAVITMVISGLLVGEEVYILL